MLESARSLHTRCELPQRRGSATSPCHRYCLRVPGPTLDIAPVRGLQAQQTSADHLTGTQRMRKFEVVLFGFLEAIVRGRADGWAAENIEGRPEVPDSARYRILDVQDLVTGRRIRSASSEVLALRRLAGVDVLSFRRQSAQDMYCDSITGKKHVVAQAPSLPVGSGMWMCGVAPLQLRTTGTSFRRLRRRAASAATA